ncbi:MAG: T9SS type A sorting domain-containing protein [Calditrichaeota bacterium]|nr:T9SS type A sorting domain-containing protein [Calditrichota bacterium]
MKRTFFTLTVLFLAIQFVWSTTYFKSWVNGAETSVMTQGDFYAWEYDLSSVGGTAHIQIYVDTNGDQTLDGSDVLLIEFNQTDGQTGEEGGPSDSSSTPDGLIYTRMGPFGFPAADYLFVVEDLNDHSSVTGPLHINAPATVNVWISGRLSIEGIQPPDERLAYFMFEATLEGEEDAAFWGGLTDDNGNFTINLPDSAVGQEWKIGFMFERQISSYITDSVSYHNVFIQNGENSGFDFNLQNPKAWVYGSVLNEDGEVVPVAGWGSLENLNTYQEVEFSPHEGQFKVGAPFSGDDTVNVPFRLALWSEELIPDYLMPDTWDNPLYSFNLSAGDSLEKNIYVYSTDTVIYVIGRMNDQPLSAEFEAWARNAEVGQTFSYMNGEPVVKLHVKQGKIYNVWLNNTDYGQLEVPPGFYLKNGNWREASPGDTVRFIFLPAQSKLGGNITIDEGDPFPDLSECSIQVFKIDWSEFYTATINPDSMNYFVGVPNDTFSLRFQSWNGEYLAMPVQYSNIAVNDDEIDTLDFELNYAHAELEVKLINAPVSNPDEYTMDISTIGTFPYVYQTEQSLAPDTSFHFRVCEGDWFISAPYFGDQYTPDKPDATVHVTEDSSYYYVEFVYLPTGIENNQPIPKSFYVKQNYPNPFNPVTTIEFGLPVQEQVNVSIFNLNGQKVATLVDGALNAGVHKLKWDGRNVASGMYFYKVTTEKKTVIQRMLLIK